MKLISIASLLLVVVVAAMVVDAQHGDVQWQPNCDYFGGDIGNVRVRGDQCGWSCINHGGCNHFTYMNGVCYLKRHDLSFRRTSCSS